ncbi:tetratricopeptide repeat protein [Aureisphaera galaxeae]|uniref:tetratricopeptide repeat protein n=1 Tax=Aureisphaera galaxeae TaxID=1538023 RepID=UPI00234FE1B5|nr:tetratricopeptide repeat protein [Aureisphaera galaxeae]MDC8003396.1 tetratricopeptide repeat protein [Aureisphaera galaxeae]
MQHVKEVANGNPLQLESTNALKNLIYLYTYRERNSDSIFKYAKVLEQAAQLQNDSLLFAEAYLGYGAAHSLEASYNDALSNAKKALSIFEKHEVDHKVASAQIVLGRTHLSLFENKEAMLYYKKAKMNAVGSDRILVHLGLARSYSLLIDKESSLRHFKTAFDLTHDLADDTFLFDIYNGIAGSLDHKEDYEQVINSLENAIEIAEKQNSPSKQVVGYHNLGIALNANNKFEEAKPIFEKTIALFPKISDQYVIGSTYRQYAQTHLELGDIREATRYLDLAEAIYKKINPNRLWAIITIRAHITYSVGKFDEAIALLQESIEMTKKQGALMTLSECYITLSEWLEYQGYVSESLEALKNYKAVKDSLFNQNKGREIEALKTQFEIAHYEQDLLVKDQELAILDSKQKASKYRNILFVCIAIGLSIFFYRERKINKMNKSAIATEKELSRLKEARIDYSKREITEYAIHIFEYNKLLDACLSQIKTLKRRAKEDTVKKGLTDLQFFIKDNMDINKEKVTLDMKVKSEQEDFTFKLKSKYPDLSKKEIQVAIYALLNMTSKQAANQMGIKEQSVYNYRLSLRKKLGISSDTNLAEFLKKI